MYLEWLILVAGVLGVLLIHELGHLVAARFLGLKVSSLSIGLGPEIIGYTDRSGTRWKVALLPMGGSCAFDRRSFGFDWIVQSASVSAADGGRLVLVAIEACRGRPVAEKDEKQLYRIGSSILAGVAIVSAFFLFKFIG